jgi:hypothetical protein
MLHVNAGSLEWAILVLVNKLEQLIVGPDAALAQLSWEKQARGERFDSSSRDGQRFVS